MFLKNLFYSFVIFCLVFSFSFAPTAHAQNQETPIQGSLIEIDSRPTSTLPDTEDTNPTPDSLKFKFDNSISLVIGGFKAKFLNVPYFNQCLEKDKTTFFPNNKKEDKEVCRYMCTSADMVMIAGYFGKLEYNKKDPHDLKKYMYSDSGQGIIESCGENQGGAFGLIATETNRITGGSTDCNSGSSEGMSRYAAKVGLYSNAINVDNVTIRAAIDRGNPVIISNGPHVLLVKGYAGNKLIVNDPYRNMEINKDNYSYNGQNALYSLPSAYYKGEVLNFNYAMEVSNSPLVVPKFNLDDKVFSSADGDGIESGISIRENPCSQNRVGRQALNSKGVIIDKAVIVESCSLGSEFKIWHKVRWENGQTGWSVENYLEKQI